MCSTQCGPPRGTRQAKRDRGECLDCSALSVPGKGTSNESCIRLPACGIRVARAGCLRSDRSAVRLNRQTETTEGNRCKRKWRARVVEMAATDDGFEQWPRRRRYACTRGQHPGRLPVEVHEDGADVAHLVLPGLRAGGVGAAEAQGESGMRRSLPGCGHGSWTGKPSGREGASRPAGNGRAVQISMDGSIAYRETTCLPECLGVRAGSSRT